MPEGQAGGPGGAPQAHALRIAVNRDVDGAGGVVLAVEEAPGIAVGADLTQASRLENAPRRGGAPAAHHDAAAATRVVRAAMRSLALPGGIHNRPAPAPGSGDATAFAPGRGRRRHGDEKG